MLIPRPTAMVVSQRNTSMTSAGMTFSTLAGTAGGGSCKRWASGGVVAALPGPALFYPPTAGSSG